MLSPLLDACPSTGTAGIALVSAATGAALAYNAFATPAHAGMSEVKDKGNDSSSSSNEKEVLPDGELDLRRMAQIARAKPSDHCGEVVLVPTSKFDLNKTIFASLDSKVARAFIQDKIAVTPFWSDKAEARIRSEFASVPRAPAYDKAIVTFMNEECDFAVEHADGSFMDHLRFCFEYSYQHFPKKSPKVLLLHSILGVGTNFFPMPAEKIPTLQKLLTPEEFQHVQIFPTFLRLLQSGLLMDDLLSRSKEDLKKMDKFTCHRCIDNKEVTIDAEIFWDQLNYQLIHLLDFLPASSWKLHVDDNFLKNFRDLYKILIQNDQLRCTLNYDTTEGSSSAEGQPRTLVSLLRGALPSTLAINMARNALKRYSAKINHSLNYSICYAK